MAQTAIAQVRPPNEVLDELSFGYRAHHVGQRLWVGYRPDKPEQAQVWRVWASFMVAAILFAGVFALWLGTSRTSG